MRIRFRDEDFDGSLRCHAWQAPGQHLSVDGTIELEARSRVAPERRILGLVHGHLARTTARAPFAIPLNETDFHAILECADSEGTEREPETGCLRIPDAQWVVGEGRIPKTVAPQFAGGAHDILESRFQLGSDPWMQDWPLEVSNPERLEEFCNFYDDSSDTLVRFDTMQLVLYSLELCTEHWANWLTTRLRRDFAIHGHTIAYWACLQRDAADPEFRRRDPEFVFPISGILRTIWEESLVPVEAMFV